MKIPNKSHFWVALGIVIGLPVCGQPAKTASPKTEPAQSVFIMPSNPSEGRDPFFPESTRPYETAVAPTNHTETVAITDLTVKGFTVMNGRAEVIINNHPFMVGDEGDVRVPAGRIHLRCLEIRDGYVIIEVNGQRHELRF